MNICMEILKIMKAKREEYRGLFSFTVRGRKPYMIPPIYESFTGDTSGSFMMKKPKIPIRVTRVPMMVNIRLQELDFSKSKNINPPKTTKIATSGIIEFIPSTEPLLVESVESVSQALKAASLAEEPKKVIAQSKTIVSEMPSEAADTVGKSCSKTSSFATFQNLNWMFEDISHHLTP